ncbi:MAG: DivIVA domain-containing protein [Acidimicrobiales bacterium]|jgi:DivIVA domain-containing protein|nr:DivIVA domain-containing protein [Acidimicrobiales bacterium]
MDVTPQLLREVEFREKFRGYDPDQVDELLERAGQQIAQLQGRLREALERAEQAEARAATGGGGYSETEETLRRTLVLAQKTADAVVAEANEVAAKTRSEADGHARRVTADADAYALRIRAEVDEERTTALAEARVEARRMVAEATAQSDAIRAEAAAEARRVIESTRLPLREEIRELEQVRDQLQDDIAMLSGHVEQQRERLAASIAALQLTVADPEALRVAPAPAASAVQLPEPHEYGLDEPSPSAAETDDLQPSDTAADEVGSAVEEADAAADVDEEPDEPTMAFRPVLADELEPVIALDLTDQDGWDDDDEDWDDEDDWSDPPFGVTPAPAVGAVDPQRYEEPTVSPTDIDDEAGGRDPFLDQLRQAVDEAGEDDHTTKAMEAFFEPDADDRRSRFGRKR